MRSIWPQMVLEHNRRSTWTRPLSIETKFMRKSGSGSRSVGIRWVEMILPGIEDPRNYLHPRNLGQSEWDSKLGKIECVFSLYDKMSWKWDDVYVLRGLPIIYSPSLCLPLLPLCLRTLAVAPLWCARLPRDRVNTEMHMEARIERVWRCTWRPRLRELREALGSRGWACWEIHLEAMIEQDWWSTWRQLMWKRVIWGRSIGRQCIWRR